MTDTFVVDENGDFTVGKAATTPHDESERIDVFGDAVIPLYEHEGEAAAEELIADGVEAIVVHFLYSYLNPQHEKRAEEILRAVIARSGKNGDLPVYLGSELRPVI